MTIVQDLAPGTTCALGARLTAQILHTVACDTRFRADFRAGTPFATLREVLRQSDEYEGLTESIIGCGLRVHQYFGPGLFESVYKRCLIIELGQANLPVNESRRVPLVYRDVDLECVFIPDLVVADHVVVEVKSVETFARVHVTQLITYLKLTGCPVGLLVNFNVSRLRDGIRRVVHPDRYKKK